MVFKIKKKENNKKAKTKVHKPKFMPALHKLFKNFPPPEVLQMRSVGINISDHSVKLIEMLPSGGGMYRLGAIESEPLPVGTVSGGQIQNPDAIIDILKGFKKKHNLRFVRASIPEEKAFIVSVRLPQASSGDIYSALEFQITDHVPISQSEVVFDYDLVAQDEQSGHLEVNVSALPISEVQTLLDIFYTAKLIPLSFEIESQSSARSLIPKGDPGTFLTVDVGRTRTGLAIISDGVVRYTSTVDFGGDTFIKILSEGYGISREEAETAKQEKGLVQGLHEPLVYQKLLTATKALQEEIERRVDYWDSQVARKEIKATSVKVVILAGGNATTPALREYLAGGLHLPVTIANVWRNAFSLEEYIPPIDFNNSLGYASAIGLALSDEF